MESKATGGQSETWPDWARDYSADRGDLPPAIGRYQVRSLLGEGAFGRVFLAYDDRLGRHVAVKVPHRALVSNPDRVREYLGEARTLAALDHPHIVPVYDAGSQDEFPCFIVSKYVEGITLAAAEREAP